MPDRRKVPTKGATRFLIDRRKGKAPESATHFSTAFGYWFDFGDDWFHQINLVRIEQAVPTVAYPRVIKRVGMSPPQYESQK